MKKRLLATLAGFVVFFLLGWLLYGMVLMDFFNSNQGTATGVMRAETEMVWWALVVGNLLQAYLLVYIFGNWANITTFGGGFKSGLIIGLIIGYGVDLTMYGTTNIMNLTGALVDPLVIGVMMGATGGVIGVVLGKK
ncbi:MAG: hypothetical protein HRU69_03330 [Flammeovirgaceae bacterium]|nr:MAG: hypothetical protein HRU69_03330 [Flammeovirgaceae bacterium]